MALFGKKKKQADEAATLPPAATSGVATQDVAAQERAADEFAAADLLASSLAADAVRDPDAAFQDTSYAGDTQSTLMHGALNGYSTAAKHHAAKKGAVVGLNIGSDTIKAVELRAKGGDLVVTALGMVPTPAESIANGVVMSAGAIARAVREVFSQAGIKTKKTVVSIAGTNALVVRVIEVPRMTDAELKDNLAMDADRYIPFPAAEVVMDHQALRELPSDPDAANMEVLLAAAQSEVVDSLVKVMQDAKLDPQAIDVEPLAAARALMPDDGAVNYNNVTALINIGAAGTEISVLRGNILVFTRTVPVGGNRITEALVESFGLSWAEAERLKRESADAMPPAGGMADNLAPANFDDTAFDAGFAAPATASAPAATFPAAAATSTPVASGSGVSASAESSAHSDWGDFDVFAEGNTENAAPAGTASAGATPGLSTPVPGAAAPATADPFDLDFFDQGPQSNEPPEQHGQQEPPDNSPIFSFDEVHPDEAAATAPQATEGTSTQSAPAGESTPTGLSPEETAWPAIPSAFDFAFDVDEDDNLLPAVTGGAETAIPFMVGGQEDFTAPSSLSSDETAMADFSDINGLTAAQSSPQESETPASTPAPTPTSFGFAAGETPEPLPANEQSTQAAETQPLQEGAALTESPAESPDFDLDELFGDTGAASELPAEPVLSSAPSLSDTPAALADMAATGTMGAVGDPESMEFDIESIGAGLSEAEATGDGIDAATLYSVVQPALDSLVDEVRRSLEYHASRAPDAPVRQIVLIGGGARLKNMDAYVTQALGMPAVLGDPLALVTVAAPKLGERYAVENSPVFAVALGLALRELT